MRRQIPSLLEIIYRTVPKFWSGRFSPPWNILMENARTLLSPTGCSHITWGPVHATDPGLVLPNLGIHGYREFSVTFPAQAVASSQSWGFSLSSFQGSCAQNPWQGAGTLSPVVPAFFCAWELIPPEIPAKCSQRDLTDPTLP